MERKKEEPFIPTTPDTVEEALKIYSVLQDITNEYVGDVEHLCRCELNTLVAEN